MAKLSDFADAAMWATIRAANAQRMAVEAALATIMALAPGADVTQAWACADVGQTCTLYLRGVPVWRLWYERAGDELEMRTEWLVEVG